MDSVVALWDFVLQTVDQCTGLYNYGKFNEYGPYRTPDPIRPMRQGRDSNRPTYDGTRRKI